MAFFTPSTTGLDPPNSKKSLTFLPVRYILLIFYLSNLKLIRTLQVRYILSNQFIGQFCNFNRPRIFRIQQLAYNADISYWALQASTSCPLLTLTNQNTF